MPDISSVKQKIFPPNDSFTMKEQLGYCGGIFGNCMAQDSVNSFYDKFFRKFMKITSEHMTLLGNIAMALGFIVTPVAGNILDTPAKPGKKTPTKIITGIAPIPFAVTSMLLFVVPTNDAFKNFIWALVFKLIYNTADTFFDSSLSTLSLRMTSSAKDRKNFYTVGTLASSLGSMLPGWLIPMVVGKTKDVVQQQNRYFFLALIFCVLGVAMMYAPYFTLNEKIRVVRREKKNGLNWDKETVISVFRNRTFLITEIATFFEQIRQISYTLLNYIYEDVMDAYSLKSVMDIVSGTLSYGGLLAVPYLESRFSSKVILSGGFAYTGLIYSVMGAYLFGFKQEKLKKAKYIIGILIGVAGMPNNAISASKKVMVGDSTDYMEWYAEKRFGRPIHAEGFICAMQGVLNNIFDVIRTNVYNIVFGKLGYQPNVTDENGKEVAAVQSEKTLKGIYMMFILCGVIGNFLASLSYLFDNYNGKRKEDITAELAQMRETRAAQENAI